MVVSLLTVLVSLLVTTTRGHCSLNHDKPSHKPLPPFILDHAPLSHLWSQETWFPSDVSAHLTHVVPQVNFTNTSAAVTFGSISSFGEDVFLTSRDPVEDQPEWMLSSENKPNQTTGRSKAPATIIAVEKGAGILDAFYFYFYSFDKGNAVCSGSIRHTGISGDVYMGHIAHYPTQYVVLVTRR